MSSHLEDLPREIFLWICSFLNCKDCKILKQVCKRFLNLLNDIGEGLFNPELILSNKGHIVISISADGNKIAYDCGLDWIDDRKTVIKIFDNKTGKNSVILVGTDRILMAYFFDDDKKIIILFSYCIEIWDIDEAKRIWYYFSSLSSITHRESCLSQNKEKIAIVFSYFSCKDYFIEILDLKNCKYEISDTILMGKKIPTSIVFSSSGKYIAIAMEGYENKIVNLETEEKYIVCDENKSTIFDMVFFSADKKLIIANGHKTDNLKIWNLEKNNCQMILKGHKDTVKGIALFSNERKAISASLDKTLKIWDIINGNCLFTIDIEMKIYNFLRVASKKDANYEKIIYTFWNNNEIFEINTWKIAICRLHW